MNAIARIDMRMRAATLAAAVALVLPGCSRPESEAAQSPVAEAPIEADAEARLPHLVRPVIVEAPSDEAADPAIDATDPPAGDADRESRDAALRYMARRDGVADPPRPDVERPGTATAGPGHALPERRTPEAASPTPAPRAAAPAVAAAASRAAIPRDADAPAPRAARDPAQARSLNQQAIALIGAGRAEQAIPALERAVALQPRDAEMLGNLGYAYLLAGEHDRARTQFVRSLDLAPTRSATWLNLGQAYAELGERDVAVDAVVKGYRYSTRKASVRSALERAAAGNRHSRAWREAAGLALERIGARA